MTKAKTKMPKLRAPSLSPPSQREWDEYSRQMVQYTKEQLARKDAKIAALERKVERLKRKSEKDWKWFSDATGGYM